MTAFGRYAEIYDDMMRIVNYDGMFAAVEKLLNHYNLKVNSVLELACGTGNLTLKLAEKGLGPIFGIDNSDQMLAKAESKFSKSPFRVTLIHGDIRNFEIPAPVDLVQGVFGCINYLLDVNALCDMFISVRRSLKPGGVFIFDLFTEAQVIEVYQGTHFRDEVCASQIYLSSYDNKNKIEEAKVTVFVPNQTGGYDRFDEVHLTRVYTLEEVVSALNRAGLTLMGYWVPGILFKSEESSRPHIVCRNS